jgi:hypothetical protein
MKYEPIVKATNEIISQYKIRLTIRQIYYRIVSPPYQLFENVMRNYKQFDRILTRARERGDVNWRAIEDRARSTIGGDFGYGGVGDFLDRAGSITGASKFQRRRWNKWALSTEVEG